MNYTENQLLEWLRFCWTLQSLKELTRQGSAAAGFNRGDSDTIAAHTASVGLISLTLACELKASKKIEVDPSYVASVALVHDLNSAILGDINFEVKKRYFPEHKEGERLAFHDLVNGLRCSSELLKLYDTYKTQFDTTANIVRFSNGLDGWLEVMPRASLAWMEQHKDYRTWIYKLLQGDKLFGDELAKMYDKICNILYENKIPPKRPSSLENSKNIDLYKIQLDGLPLTQEQTLEWLQICQTIQKLKRLTRQGFITSGGFNRWDTDSIADHIGLVAIISFTLALELREIRNKIDPYHVVALALVHDVGESILGDVSSESKKRYYKNYGDSERLAIQDLTGNLLSSATFLSLFDEFELCSTSEARIVRFADSLDAWMHVVPRSQQTWMPQHIEYRNRTFERLKGDEIFGDELAELFLRACLAIQGQVVSPKRPPKPKKEEAMNSLTANIASEIADKVLQLRERQKHLKLEIDDSQGTEKQRLLTEKEEIQVEIANAQQILLGLHARLSIRTKREKS
jgi:putative hydrolase of HD superfamily